MPLVIDIDWLGCAVHVFKDSERTAFEEKTSEETAGCHGLCSENNLFISDLPERIGTCNHEAVHAVDWILETHLAMQQGTLWGNTELRAWLTERIGTAVRKYVCGE